MTKKQILIDEAVVRQAQERPQNCGTGYCSCIECLYEQPAPAQEPLPKSEWPKHPSAYKDEEYHGYAKSDLDDYAMQVLAAHGITSKKD